MRDRKIEFLDDSIEDEYGFTIMHSWEDSMMKKHAEVVCRNGGDILEIGFGMGISATYIQHQNIKSHTIIEIHPVIARRAREWAKDKPNVIIIEADWYDVVDDLKTYDGIFYDPELDPNMRKFPKIVKEKLLKDKGIFSFYNTITNNTNKSNGIKQRNNILKRFFIKNNKVEYVTMDIEPPTSDDENSRYFSPSDKKYDVPFIIQDKQ
jgi:predicted O-methyltransferase YrrM